MSADERLDVFVAYLKKQAISADRSSNSTLIAAIDEYYWQSKIALNDPIAMQAAEVDNDLLMSTAIPVDNRLTSIQHTISANTAKLNTLLSKR